VNPTIPHPTSNSPAYQGRRRHPGTSARSGYQRLICGLPT